MQAATLSMKSGNRAAEDSRLAALARHDILDTPPEPEFDRVTRLTRTIFGVSMATITLIDAHRQWFKSRQGLTETQTDRRPALCSIAIRGATPLIVPDTLQDDRFRDNPFVTDAPHIRFYAGAPLMMPDGAIIGTLCAMDIKPRVFDNRAVAILTDLAGIVSDAIARRPPSTDTTLPSLADPAPIALVCPTPRDEPSYRRVLKAGRIIFNAGRSIVDCTLRGLSDQGALLDVVSTAGIPGTFRLAILTDDVSRACRVIAKRDSHIEVAFE